MDRTQASPEGRRYFEKLHETPAFGASGFDLAGLRSGMATRRAPDGLDVRCMPVDIDGLPGEWVVASNADPDLRLLYLHGGGFVSGSGAFYLTMAARLSQATGFAVLLPDYRLAPEHPFPLGLEDCLTALAWLEANGPDGPGRARARVIAGDSAGGGLTLGALLALRDQGRALPEAAVAISPFADMTLAGESLTSEADRDPIMSPRCLPDFVRLYLGDADPTDPLASPIFGDFRGLPPLLIQAGEHEIIRDDSVRVAARARQAGVTVRLDIYPGMFHVFQSHEPLLPEAALAFESMGRFARSCLGS